MVVLGVKTFCVLIVICLGVKFFYAVCFHILS